MTDTWASKVLEGVDRIHPWNDEDAYIAEADALAAIARMGAGDGLVAELEMSARIWETAADHKDAPTFSRGDCRVWAERFSKTAAHIADLTAQDAEATRLMVGAQRRMRQYKARAETAEAERDALRERVAKLVEAAEGLSAILDKHETKGPLPDVAMMLCWLAAQNIRAVLRGNILEKPE